MPAKIIDVDWNKHHIGQALWESEKPPSSFVCRRGIRMGKPTSASLSAALGALSQDIAEFHSCTVRELDPASQDDCGGRVYTSCQGPATALLKGPCCPRAW